VISLNRQKKKKKKRPTQNQVREPTDTVRLAKQYISYKS